MIGYLVICIDSGLLLSSKSFLDDGGFGMVGIGTEPFQLASTLFALYKSSPRAASERISKEHGGLEGGKTSLKAENASVNSQGLRWIKFGKMKLIYQEVCRCCK